MEIAEIIHWLFLCTNFYYVPEYKPAKYMCSCMIVISELVIWLTYIYLSVYCSNSLG